MTAAIAVDESDRAGRGGAGRPSPAPVAPRYEIKYWATERQVAALLRMVAPYTAADRHAAAGPQRNVSLYLDSPRRTFLDQHLAGAAARLKLRVRTYDGGGGPSPAFLEVKRRVNAVVVKRRTAVPRQVAAAILDGDLDAARALPAAPALSEFLVLCQRHLARPLVLVAAQRLALQEGEGSRHALRLTVDRDVRYQLHRPLRGGGVDLDGRPGAFAPVDVVARSGHPARSAIVELKFDHAAPAWLPPAIAALGLVRTSFSKYVAALAEAAVKGGG